MRVNRRYGFILELQLVLVLDCQAQLLHGAAPFWRLWSGRKCVKAAPWALEVSI
jgi:hypothetical protein